MLIIDTLLVGGLTFVLRQIAAAVDAELNDDTVFREELLAAQMRLELGEMTEAEYAEIERALLAAIREVRERRTGAGLAAAGDVRITGIEASAWSEEEDADDEGR